MQRMHFRLMGVGLAVLLCGVYPALGGVPPAAMAPNLGTQLPRFGVLGGAGVTGSTGLGTTVTGDVGSSPTPTILEFIGSTIPGPSRAAPPFIVHYTNDAVVQQAHNEAIAAYNNLSVQGLLGDPLGPQLDMQILTPGVYRFAAQADLAANGTLELNGAGIFIFYVDSTLTTNVNSRIIGTANPCNVYWRVGTSATLNGNNFYGNVFADQAVTVASRNPLGTIFTDLRGRAIAINAAVTMPGAGGNTIGTCSAGVGPPGPPPAAGAGGGPTLDAFGMAVLLGLLAVAGVFAVNRFTS